MLNTVWMEYPFSCQMQLMFVTCNNSSSQESTGDSPHPPAMVYGKEVTLPISSLDPTAKVVEWLKASSASEYILQFQRNIKTIHNLARDRMHRVSLKQEKGYNNKLQYRKYNILELVYYE